MTIEQHSDRLNEDINIFYYKYMYLYIIYTTPNLCTTSTTINIYCIKFRKIYITLI